MYEVTRSVRVLTFAGMKGDGARYEAYDEDHGQLRTRLRIPSYDWMDLGRPLALTVTLEPADLPAADGLVARLADTTAA